MRRSGPRLAVVLLIVGTAVGTAPVLANHRPGPCSFHRDGDETVRHFSKRLIVCAVDRFGPVPGDAERAICIAKRESGLDPTATSEPTGQYRGLFQHDRDYWPWRYDTFTKPAWDLSRRALNGRTNAIVTMRMVAHFGTWKEAGWPKKEC